MYIKTEKGIELNTITYVLQYSLYRSETSNLIESFTKEIGSIFS